MKGPRVLAVILVVVVASFVAVIRYAFEADGLGAAQSLGRVYRYAGNDQIIWAKLLDEDAQVVGRVCSVPLVAERRCPAESALFHAAYPRSDVSTQALIEALQDAVPVVVDKQTGKAVAKVLATLLFPMLILANLFGIIFLSRGGQGGGVADVIGFGRIARRRQQKRNAPPPVTFADVAGAEVAVAELREVTDYLTNPRRFEEFGASPPRGVLLFGPPGCGKTLLARAVAGESQVAFVPISGAAFVESLVGVGAARVRDLFAQVRALAPAIVFIDEIDAVGRSREGEGASGGEREQTLNQLLVEMDGFEVTSGIVVMGATNRPDILDPALLRPGRFDRHITLEAPDVHGRQAILELHAAGKPIGADVDFEALARSTPGFTGADLANVVNEGALVAMRQGAAGTRIRASDLGEAVQRVLHGPQRRGRLMTAEERKRIAYHEAGHALVAAAVGHGARVHRVSVMARGEGLGHAMIGDDQDRVLLTRSELEDQLAVVMGGVSAEELCFGEASTAGEHDVERANRLARRMAGRYGMAPDLGRLLVLTRGGYLNESAGLEPVSGQSLAAFDHEVTRLIAAAEARALALLERHREHLEHLAGRLEEEESLEGAGLEALLGPVRPQENLLAAGGPPSNGAAPRSRARGRARP
ncbi:MAG: ATP-dependent zinc metalloprotease FtsH [Acidimicrobiales bacterium]